MTEISPAIRTLCYTRVITCVQTLDAQLDQLSGAGCTKIYREKANVRFNGCNSTGCFNEPIFVVATRVDAIMKREHS